VEERRRPRRCARAAARLLGWAGAALLAAHAADASSVRSVSVSEMLQDAELVFEGRVLDRHVVDEGNLGAIQTCVRFEVLDVVKGPPVSSPLELCFAGGRGKQGLTYAVAGVDQPDPGERGIYFVTSLGARQINPLYGWDQGHFRVRADGGEVTTAGGAPVVALDPSQEGPVEGPSRGVARGAVVAKPGARGAAAPLDAAAFKARLRELLAEGR
jgi:hypothetical protein